MLYIRIWAGYRRSWPASLLSASNRENSPFHSFRSSVNSVYRVRIGQPSFIYDIGGYLLCANIKTLFNFEPPVTEDEIRAASLQFVRKITGFTKPSKANEAVFETAVQEVAAASARLLHSLETTASPKNREEEAAKARARAAERFGA